MSLKPISIRQWTTALRSGKYAQGFETMHCPEDATFCCLGVAEDIAGCEWNVDDDYAADEYGEASLPFSAAAVMGAAGRFMLKRSPGADTDEVMHSLAYMNDERRSFDEIADYIETLAVDLGFDLDAAE